MTQSAGNIFRFDGKTSVIIGGGSGIGRAIALKFPAQAPKSIFLISARKMRKLPVSKSQRQEGLPAAIAAT
jgi:short-subunit dehydrogenase involved in D-alanine esterification of teichoic acids